MATPAKRNGNWTPDGKAERVLLRREYLETTPGYRVEQVLAFSLEMSKLALRGLRRHRSEAT